MKKILLIIALFGILIIGAYYLGYKLGSANTTIEYITKEKEVIKYVEKTKSDIYAKPNITRDTALQLFNEGRL